ncbi:CmpA/NrtA family ABC transporter substrate-binding protein [Caenispirillum bisanense]|uniref:NitT/TauT family transport system ATP-binding protein/nitrate/nitrite transport system substrate-binding protein n=1 Tax=Caenispirillum bisanense TaxID=414052 RepID=A0A286GML9_9PROT|nr:CmpA/NrtA family ABC transporter substrate-binding protein [Caenispirillum bisanense]SOD96329.1 NitT/TauT family transport system ATP-binding protein/nitrate/nitrite transport system substrate-binding protein [Caenispirillum bisanense]
MAETVTLGFVPLVDCAVPVVARELGFAAAEGIDLVLEREAGWAAVRDKLAFGLLDAAHILAPLPLALHLGLGGIPAVPMAVPMALGLGGNAITVSLPLFERMSEADPDAMAGPRAGSARALKAVIEADRTAGRPPLSFATVFPFSSHTYELRAWLAGAGIDPDRDVNLGVVAPARMVESLASGWIDGYCVGEPWNLRAVQRGIGAVVASKWDIRPDAPEKVLGLRAAWVDQDPARTVALVRALVKAAAWADAAENRPALAQMLAAPDYVGTFPEVIAMALTGRPVLQPGGEPVALDTHVFFRDRATEPLPERAQWLVEQMLRWDRTGLTAEGAKAALAAVWRPELWAAAVG